MSAVPALGMSRSTWPSSLLACVTSVGGRPGVGQIGADDGDPPAPLTGVGRGLLCVVGVAAVGQAQVCALVGEAARDGLADAAGRSR